MMKQIGDLVWRHQERKTEYVILGFGLREHDLVPVVYYQDKSGEGGIFNRPCEEFFDGRYMPKSRAGRPAGASKPGPKPRTTASGEPAKKPGPKPKAPAATTEEEPKPAASKPGPKPKTTSAKKPASKPKTTTAKKPASKPKTTGTTAEDKQTTKPVSPGGTAAADLA